MSSTLRCHERHLPTQLKDIGRPLAVGTISFVVATLIIAIVLIVLLAAGAS